MCAQNEHYFVIFMLLTCQIYLFTEGKNRFPSNGMGMFSFMLKSVPTGMVELLNSPYDEVYKNAALPKFVFKCAVTAARLL